MPSSTSVEGHAARAYDTLFVGDLVPWFRQRCFGQTAFYSFDMAAGRYVVLCFYGAAADPLTQGALTAAHANGHLFDSKHLAFFGVSNEAAPPPGGLRHFADADGVVCRAFGVAPREGAFDLAYLRRGWIVLDPRLRVIATFPLGAGGDEAAMRFLQNLPQDDGAAQVPVLMIPGVFEPAFCARLIGLHQSGPGIDSGVLTEGGAVTDHVFKSRRDFRITERAMVDQVQTRIFRRVVPEIRHAFQFSATRLERMIIACYDAAENGRFGAHRDNTIPDTAHRRFAVSINLNDDFEGGGIAFPEYGSRTFKPPMGGALVFSCSLLHAVLPLVRGRRFACLPFVYDDQAAQIRRAQRGSISAPPQPGPVATPPE